MPWWWWCWRWPWWQYGGCHNDGNGSDCGVGGGGDSMDLVLVNGSGSSLLPSFWLGANKFCLFYWKSLLFGNDTKPKCFFTLRKQERMMQPPEPFSPTPWNFSCTISSTGENSPCKKASQLYNLLLLGSLVSPAQGLLQNLEVELLEESTYTSSEEYFLFETQFPTMYEQQFLYRVYKSEGIRETVFSINLEEITTE